VFRKAEARAQARSRLIDREPRAVCGDLQFHTPGLVEVHRPEVGSVEHLGGSQAAALQIVGQGELVGRIGGAERRVVQRPRAGVGRMKNVTIEPGRAWSSPKYRCGHIESTYTTVRLMSAG